MPSTVDKQVKSLRAANIHLDGHLLRATADDLERFLASKGRLSSRTRYWWISCLHGFYVEMVRRKVVKADPTLDMPRPKLRKYLPRPILTADLEFALAQADPKMRAWLSLAAYQGMRCAEISGVERRDVLEQNDPPVIVVMRGKGDKQRVVPLHPYTAMALHALPSVLARPGVL